MTSLVRLDIDLIIFAYYPAITSCVYHEDDDDIKNINGTLPQEPRKDIIMKHIYYFEEKEGEPGYVAGTLNWL